MYRPVSLALMNRQIITEVYHSQFHKNIANKYNRQIKNFLTEKSSYVESKLEKNQHVQ